MTMYKDALADFTVQMSQGNLTGIGYRDGPFVGFGTEGYHMDAFYKRSWLAKVAVERIPEDCFRKGYTWVGDTDAINRIGQIEQRLGIHEKKKRALMLSRLDGEGYLYFDVGDNASLPLRADAVRQLRFVNVLRKTEIIKGPIIKDPVDQYYGQPEYYEVAGSSEMVQIHPSRICRFIRNPDPSTGEGTSDLVSIMPAIVAAETARDNVVALTTEACLDIMAVDGLMEAVSEPETNAQVVARYQMFRQLKATNRMGVIDKEKEEYTKHPQSFATLPDVVEVMRREATAAMEIPYSAVYGLTSGLGANGQSDQQIYYDSIKSMQENDINPPCQLLDECTVRAALGSRPDDVYLQWLPLWEMTEKEKADIAAQTAKTARDLVDGGIVPAEVMTQATVNALVENGSFPGIETSYEEWVQAGGDLSADDLDTTPEGDSVQA